MNFFSLCTMLGGLTFFLFGMTVMSNNLEKMAGGRLEAMLKKMTANPFVSLVLGAIITIAVQSSSATTVMLVGLVNSGIMEFSQTLNVIFGANIGTTLTSWILSLSGISSDNFWINMIKPANFSPLLAFIGILMSMLSKQDKHISIGNIFVGFAVLIYGMELMQDAVSPLADMPGFGDLLMKFNNPILGVLFGTFFTAIIQSSAASIGMLQALSMTGSVTYNIAIPIVMGQNIGTCATSLISCIGTEAKAKRVAVVHTTIKTIGMIICLSAYCLIRTFVESPFYDMPVNPATIALVHTIFNIVTTALLMPFTKQLTRLTERLVPGKEKKTATTEDILHIDERLFRSPSIALSECSEATVRMGELARENLYLAMGLMDNYDKRTVNLIEQTEEEIDFCEDRLGTYLVRISAQALSERDSQTISRLLHVIGDFERLSDHALNLAKVFEELHQKDLRFSDTATREVRVLLSAIDEILAMTMDAYAKNDPEQAEKVEPLEQVIDDLISEIRSRHIDRLKDGSCGISTGFILNDLLNNCSRISDHCSNIAVAIIELSRSRFDTHLYLNGIKLGNAQFKSMYDAYHEKYHFDFEEAPV